MGPENEPPVCTENDDDLESVYRSVCEERDLGRRPVLQYTQRLKSHDDLFYETVMLGGKLPARAMIDSGSMVCTLSSAVIPRLCECNVLKGNVLDPTDVVLVGCGGSKTVPSGMCELEVGIYGCRMIVPTLVVDGQSDYIILGSNILRCLVHQLKSKQREQAEGSSTPTDGSSPERKLFSLLAGVEKRTEDLPDKVGTVKTKRAIALEPLTEHLVWGKLQQSSDMPAGSTVIMEPTGAGSGARSVMVGRTVAVLRDDGWLPIKVVNPFNKCVTIKRNARLADVYACVALESLCEPEPSTDVSTDVRQNVQMSVVSSGVGADDRSLVTDVSSLPDHHLPGRLDSHADPLHTSLHTLGLSDIDIDLCEVSQAGKEKLVDLITEFQSIFSRDKLDCGRATGCLHRIRVVDEKPLRRQKKFEICSCL